VTYIFSGAGTKSMVSRQTDYFVETYGLYMLLSTDSNVDIDWVDEEALLEPAVLQKYLLR
jgi:hypothetical protein